MAKLGNFSQSGLSAGAPEAWNIQQVLTGAPEGPGGPLGPMGP